MDIMTNDILACGHCTTNLGTLAYIIEKDLPAKHKYFVNFENIKVVMETRRVYGHGQKIMIVNEINGSGGSAGCSVLQTSDDSAGCSGIQTYDDSAVCSGNEQIAIRSPDTERSRNSTSDENEVPWTEDKIKLLIQMYVSHKHKFSSPIFTKKKGWDTISIDLAKYGVMKSGKKCDEKWRNIKKTYEKLLCEKYKTGSAPITWKFFNDLHDIYFKDPQFSPIATTSSIGKYQVQEDGTKETVSGKNLSPGEKPRIRAISALEIDERKQRRHDEKMALKREMFQWFQENSKKRKGDN